MDQIFDILTCFQRLFMSGGHTDRACEKVASDLGDVGDLILTR